MTPSALVGNSFFGLNLSKFKTSWSRFRRSISKRILLVDFDVNSVGFAELKFGHDSLFFDHVKRYQLPEDALERGIPADPALMASLITAHCEQQQIPTQMAAVVIPTDAVFTTLVEIPAIVESPDALAYALDPASSTQVPIQLERMDVELLPLNVPSAIAENRVYFLIAIPQKLTDQLLQTFQLAKLELVRVQMATVSQLNVLATEVASLSDQELILHVDLLKECSQVSVVTSTGPLKLQRMTAIREYPEPTVAEEDPEQAAADEASTRGVKDRYLPLTEQDLRRLVIELKQLIESLQSQYPWAMLCKVVLAGPGSAHPAVASLLHESIGLPVVVSRPLAASAVAELQSAQPLLVQRQGRLVGLGLSFLNRLSQPAAEAPELADVVLTSGSSDPVPPPAVVAELVTEPLAPSTHESEDLDLEPVSDPVVLPLQFHHPDFRLALPAEASAAAVVRDEPLVHPLPPQPLASANASAEPEPLEPLFRFRANDEVADREPEETLLSESHIPEQPQCADDPPFSMAELFHAYQERAQQAGEELLQVEVPLQETAQPSTPADEDVYLLNDPSLWPSVPKPSSSEIEPSARDEV